jgi:hypothetical protein
MDVEAFEELAQTRKFLRKESVCPAAMVKAEPVPAIRLVMEEVASVLEAEKVRCDEVHRCCIPKVVNVDTIWRASRFRNRCNYGKKAFIEYNLCLSSQSWRAMNAGLGVYVGNHPFSY